MEEGEVPALKEALRTQQQLLQKLYVELEAEREASSTAANETLSKIWRLQEQKAAENMEASQYRRMAEEKMKHAEESMAAIEEIMCQREMESASLQYQIQAYRCRLLSMGFSDKDIAEGRFLRHHEAHCGGLGGLGTVKRNRSLPAIQSKDHHSDSGILDTEGSVTRTFEEDLTSYWEQIKQLDERVKELSCSKDVDERVNSGWSSCNRGVDQSTNFGYPEELEDSPFCSAFRRDVLYNQTRGLIRTRVDYEGSSSYSSSQPDDPVNLVEFDESSFQSSETENIRYVGQTVNIHDVYEVPQVSEAGKFCGPQKQQGKKLASEGRSRLGKLDPIQQEPVECCCKDEVEWVKPLQYAHHKDQSRDFKDGVEWVKSPPQYAHHHKDQSRDAISFDCNSNPVDPQTSNSATQTEIQEHNERSEHLVSERRISIHEVSGRDAEELKLLKEIQKQLKTIKSEIRIIKSKMSPPQDVTCLDAVMEAMFFYSL